MVQSSAIQTNQLCQTTILIAKSCWAARLPSFESENLEDGSDQNVQIHKETLILDVVEVVPELDKRVLHRGAVAVVHLRPAGDPWLYCMPQAIEWNFFLQKLHETRPFRT